MSISCDKLISVSEKATVMTIAQRRGKMSERPCSEGGNAPSLGAAEAKFVGLFERALDERAELKRWIETLSSKSKPTVRERLCLALYRHQLSFREPPLPRGAFLTGVSIWDHWSSHEAEHQEHCRLEAEIRSYLESPEAVRNRAERNKATTMTLIQLDQLTFMACYPVVDEMYGKLQKKSGRGAPATRRLIAVQALQMHSDGGRTWASITEEICDCPKKEHDWRCAEAMRQSVNGLKRFLRRFPSKSRKPSTKRQ